jgi:hypothetical protein
MSKIFKNGLQKPFDVQYQTPEKLGTAIYFNYYFIYNLKTLLEIPKIIPIQQGNHLYFIK